MPEEGLGPGRHVVPSYVEAVTVRYVVKHPRLALFIDVTSVRQPGMDLGVPKFLGKWEPEIFKQKLLPLVAGRPLDLPKSYVFCCPWASKGCQV